MPMNRSSLPDSSTNVVKVSECYEVGKILGSGRYGVVKECTHKLNSQQFAGKFLKRRQCKKVIGTKNELQNEIDILKSLKHPCIIKLFEVFETTLEVVLILELVSGGELFEYLTIHNVIKEDDVVCFIRQILEALQYMHVLTVVHMDLKPENIVLKNTITKDIKLIDFGLSRKLETNVELRELTGTPEFVAPEVVNFDPLTCAVDMWSVGVITYVMISGNSPFLGDNPQDTLCNVSLGAYDFEEFGKDTSQISKDFINSLLCVKPRRRMNAAEALKHSWIEPRNEKEIESRGKSKINMEKLISFVARKKWKKSFHAVSIYNHFLQKAVKKTKQRKNDILNGLNDKINGEDEDVNLKNEEGNLNESIEERTNYENYIDDKNPAPLTAFKIDEDLNHGKYDYKNDVDIKIDRDKSLKIYENKDQHVIPFKCEVKNDVIESIDHKFVSDIDKELKTTTDYFDNLKANDEVKLTKDFNNFSGRYVSQKSEKTEVPAKMNTSFLLSRKNHFASEMVDKNKRKLPKQFNSKSHFTTSTSTYLSTNIAPLTPPIQSFQTKPETFQPTILSFVRINIKKATIEK